MPAVDRPPRSLAISSGAGMPPADVACWVDCLARSGVDAIQVREKGLPDGRLFEMLQAAVEAAAGRLRVLVNARFDVALAAGAHGVHLPADGLPTASVRRVLGARATLGRSTHQPEEVTDAARGGADYVTFGPIYETPAKSLFGRPQGLAALRSACSHGLPVLAIGGVNDRRLAELAAAGAWGVAAIRLFQTTADELRNTVRLIQEHFAP